MQYSFWVRHCKNIKHVEQVICDAKEVWPQIENVIDEIAAIPVWLHRDGTTYPECDCVKNQYILHSYVSINFRFLWSQRLGDKYLRGILWHELGHILSFFICLEDKRFSIGEEGTIVYTPEKKSSSVVKEICVIRNGLLDAFWKEERKKYGDDRIDEIENAFRPHLTALNFSELIAESYKYFYAGEKYISEDLYVTVRNIIIDFLVRYIRPHTKNDN